MAAPQGSASGAASNATTPDEYTAKFATLSFALEGTDIMAEDSWQILPGLKGKACKENVGPVLFEYSLTVTQGNKKKVSCSVKWTGMKISDAQVTRGPEEGDDFFVQVMLTDKGVLETTGDEDQAGQLPLARQHETFRHLRLAIRPDRLTSVGGTKALRLDDFISHLLVHLTGNIILHSQDRWRRNFKEDLHALNCETEAQLNALGVFKDVEIRTRQGRNARTLLVEVHRGQSTDVGKDEGVHYDPEKKVGQSYAIDKSSLFVKGKEAVKDYPCIGGAFKYEWQIDVANETDSERSRFNTLIFVGVVKNSFVKGGMQDFVGRTEEHVSLAVIFNDFQADRMRAATGRHRDDLVAASKLDHGFDYDSMKANRLKTSIPIDTLLGGLKCDKDDNKLLQGEIDLPDEVAQKLNASQVAFCKLAKQSKVAVAVGPPGTGKSTTVAALIRALLRSKDTNTKDKVAVVAVTNVAIDAALESAIKFWQSLEPDTQTLAPFVRVYSDSSIMRQWQDDRGKLDSPYHIDALRYTIAMADQSKWTAYCSGREQLQQFGRIDQEGLLKGYLAHAKLLSRQVLNASSAVFSTVATCQSTVLYEEEKVDGTLVWHFPATSIIVDEAGTVHRPHLMIAIMSFLSAQRLVLAGDPYQLPPFTLSEGAKEVWPPSYLDDIIKRGYPSKMINVQYRMHDQLYAHLVKVIYKKPIDSARKSSDDSPYLKTLLRHPILASGRPGEVFKLRSFLHFLDVSYGIQRWEESGSSSNQHEVDVIDSLVRNLLTRDGIKKKDIGVMTGYRAQRKLLWTKAVANGWADVNFIGTIDSSQGSQYKIVILSLVTTDGLPKFMRDSHRANVATSRQQEALYLVGKHQYWSEIQKVKGWFRANKTAIHNIVADMTRTQGPTFVVGSQSLAPDQANPAPELAAEPIVEEEEEEEEEEGDVGQAETDSLGRAYERAMMNKLMTLEELKEGLENDLELVELRREEAAKRQELQEADAPVDDAEIHAGSRRRLRQLQRDYDAMEKALDADIAEHLVALMGREKDED
ncbi:MAG: hypothetical protein LQ341_001668 [Variospora aurantia]|nr:MAG: hypothetical protein LQ341_001668 [Variospora aurantia]